MGARGLTLSVLCGELIAAQLHGEPLPLDHKLAQHLGTERLARSIKKRAASAYKPLFSKKKAHQTLIFSAQ